MCQCYHKGPSLTGDAITLFELKAKVTRLGDGRQVSGRSTDSLDCCCQNDLAADRPYRPASSPVHHTQQQAEAITNSSRMQQSLEWTPLMRERK